MTQLQYFLDEYIQDPEDPVNNWNLALEYDQLGQTAAALSYYLRTAERTDDNLLAYESMIRGAMCYEKQGARQFTVRGMLQHAISIMPHRPEAYLKLSTLIENASHWDGYWFDSYTMASIGLAVASSNLMLEPLRTDVGYYGSYQLLFQKAHTAWWCGMPDEALSIFRQLSKQPLPEPYRTLVLQNLEKLDDRANIPFPLHTRDKHDNLKYKFRGSREIEQNYSEAYQDMFVLSALNGAKNGTYVEIGSGQALYGNNTMLLEKMGWTGVSIDINQTLIRDHNMKRKHNTLLADATTVDYAKLFEQQGFDKTIDYLQVDIDPASVSLQALEQVLKSGYRFKVITFEHDIYQDDPAVKEQSQEILKANGYKLFVDNIAVYRDRPFEDWYVDNNLKLDYTFVETMYKVDGVTKIAGQYFYK